MASRFFFFLFFLILSLYQADANTSTKHYAHLIKDISEISLFLTYQQKIALKQYKLKQLNKYKEKSEAFKSLIWNVCSLEQWLEIVVQHLLICGKLHLNGIIDLDKEGEFCSLGSIMFATEELVCGMVEKNPQLQKCLEAHLDISSCEKYFNLLFKDFFSWEHFKIYYAIYSADLDKDTNLKRLLIKNMHKEIISLADYEILADKQMSTDKHWYSNLFFSFQ